MSEILQDTEDKSLDKKLGFLRLLLMILQFLILLNNFENQVKMNKNRSQMLACIFHN
jgi:hypothetical protein